MGLLSFSFALQTWNAVEIKTPISPDDRHRDEPTTLSRNACFLDSHQKSRWKILFNEQVEVVFF
jgi:hypothetical protein